MGKNQGYKAMQRAKMATQSAAGGVEDVEDGMDEAKRKEEEEDGEVRLMKEYRAQLDAERARKLARGINHVDKKLPIKGKKDKDKYKKKKKSKKRKHAGESESESDSSNDDEKHRSRRKEREKFKRDKKERGHKSHRKASGSGSETSRDEAYGPLPLSSFFEGCKS